MNDTLFQLPKFTYDKARRTIVTDRSEYDLSRLGFGIGMEPMKWRRFGHRVIGSSHWFNIGPIFLQWSIGRWPR